MISDSMKANNAVVKSKAPVRISFGTCGDSDYYTEFLGWGNGINATIDLYSYCEIHKLEENKLVLRSFETGQTIEFASPSDIDFGDRSLNMMKAVAKHYGNNGIEIITHTDAPLESGLGGSAAHAVSMIRAFNRLNGIEMTNEEVARLAYHLERNVLGLEGGYQDQWASAYGGINYMHFTKGVVQLTPVKLSSRDTAELENRLLLFYVPRERSGSALHAEQRKKAKDSTAILNMKRENVIKMKEALESRKFDTIGDIMQLDWKVKKLTAPEITNERIDNIYRAAIEAGALGGRFIGAGAGGSAIFFCPGKTEAVTRALENVGARRIRYHFEAVAAVKDDPVYTPKIASVYLKEKIDEHKKMVEILDLDAIQKVAAAISQCYKNNGKLIIFGNGGSAADSIHFAAEFEGQLSSRDKGRKPLSALTPFNTSALTAISNDYDYDSSFVRFVGANAKPGDVVIGISTSGNSKNVLLAMEEARRLGATTVGFTGNDGGKLKSLSDILLNVPVSSVNIIQEGHMISYHRICALVIQDLFGYDPMV